MNILLSSLNIPYISTNILLFLRQIKNAFQKDLSLNLALALTFILLAIISSDHQLSTTTSAVLTSLNKEKLHPLTESKKGYQVYGYAPYWTLDKLDNVDFNTLTTLAYFDIQLDNGGNIIKDDGGYTMFMSDQATKLFQKAHAAHTKVNVTVTNMNNSQIENFLDNPEVQRNAITQMIAEVKQRGIDGISVDFEYFGDPPAGYREKFTAFVTDLKTQMNKDLPGSQVTVAVYAISARQPGLYDIGALAKPVDSIFMMAYDFAVAGSATAEPTAPLYGFKEGKYGYDVSTAVEDFLKVMPADKLILGVPYYGYNYSVYQPEVKSATNSGSVQTYSIATDNIRADSTGWDPQGQVGWKAYVDPDTGAWRMIFLEDTRSLAIKYDYVKNQKLAGVGMWALGFDEGKTELWTLLKEKFGVKNLADSRGLLYK